MRKPRKSEEIKVRIDPLSKLALVQIASEEQLDLSDVARRAFRDYIKSRGQQKTVLDVAA